MQKQIIDHTYVPETNRLSNLEFKGEGKLNFEWDFLHLKHCDFSILHHVDFRNITRVEIFGPITLEKINKVNPEEKIQIDFLQVWVDRCDNIMDALFDLFICQKVKLVFWTKSSRDVVIPESTSQLVLSKINSSKLRQLTWKSPRFSLKLSNAYVHFETMSLQQSVGLENIQCRKFYFVDCTFFESEIHYSSNLQILNFQSCTFHDEFEIVIPKSIKELNFESSRRLSLKNIRFRECKLTYFALLDSYVEIDNETIIEDFDELEPISADENYGIELSIVSHRILSISNLKINGDIDKIQFITDDRPSFSFTDNFEQFAPYEMVLSPNRTMIEISKHFQNSSISVDFFNYTFADEEIIGRRFEQFLPILATLVNHPVRRSLLVLNQFKTQRNTNNPLRKLPKELIRMVGSFLAFQPDTIRGLGKDRLIEIFGEDMIQLATPPHPPYFPIYPFAIEGEI